MSEFNLNTVITIILQALPILFAITIHEVAHGWVAFKLGDSTAKMLGRLTLNPIKHIDPIGTLLIPGILLITQAPFLFGWAKPVPVSWLNLRNPRRDMALVAAAGPFSNLLMATFWAFIAKLGITYATPTNSWALALIYMGQSGILINLILMLLNLLPIPPLDGSRVITSFVSLRTADLFRRLEPYGFLMLVVLLSTGMITIILKPLLTLSYQLILNLFGLH